MHDIAHTVSNQANKRHNDSSNSTTVECSVYSFWAWIFSHLCCTFGISSTLISHIRTRSRACIHSCHQKPRPSVVICFECMLHRHRLFLTPIRSLSLSRSNLFIKFLCFVQFTLIRIIHVAHLMWYLIYIGHYSDGRAKHRCYVGNASDFSHALGAHASARARIPSSRMCISHLSFRSAVSWPEWGHEWNVSDLSWCLNNFQVHPLDLMWTVTKFMPENFMLCQSKYFWIN